MKTKNSERFPSKEAAIRDMVGMLFATTPITDADAKCITVAFNGDTLIMTDTPRIFGGMYTTFSRGELKYSQYKGYCTLGQVKNWLIKHGATEREAYVW